MLAADSAPFEVLCAADASGACQFPTEVTLSSNLDCHGMECVVDTVRVVQVTASSGESVFYQYIPLPCVWLAYYEDPKQIKIDSTGRAQTMCADPQAAAAGAACCPSEPMRVGGTLLFTGAEASGDDAGPGLGICEVAHERVSFATAQARCQATQSPQLLDGPWRYDSFDVNAAPTQWYIASSEYNRQFARRKLMTPSMDVAARTPSSRGQQTQRATETRVVRVTDSSGQATMTFVMKIVWHSLRARTRPPIQMVCHT